jgi:hypothetical protein
MTGPRWIPDLRADHGHDSLAIGDRTARVAFARPAGGRQPLSGETLWLAEGLVAATASVPRSEVRVARLAPSGRPSARVAGMDRAPSVSVSHVRGLYGAAVSTDGAVGLDLVDPVEAGPGLDVFFSPDELAALRDDTAAMRPRLWAAKESAYKAARLDAAFHPRQVAIGAISGHGFSWTVRDRHAAVHGRGVFGTVGRHVWAVALAVASDPDI